jgi:glycosyltransferase involved in cell wall biosynthesis
MRIGIYNRWLATLGGGEKYSLTIAEYLSQRHHVEVLSHRTVSKEQAAERLNLNLSRVKFLTLSDRPALEMTPITTEYDFFVNASYMDFFPSYAPFSANVVYFPAKLGPETFRRRQGKTRLREWLRLPQVMISTQAFDLERGSLDWVSDTDLKLRLPSRAAAYSVQFDLRACAPTVTQATVMLNGLTVEQVKFSGVDQPQTCRIQVPAIVGKKFHELLVIPEDQENQFDGQPRLAISHLSLGTPTYWLYQHLLARNLMRLNVRLEFSPPGAAVLDYLDTYNAIWSISEYSRSWIERYWNRPSEILYPPVDVESFNVGEKCPQILSVGRFFAGQHNKKHKFMIAAFKHMVDRGLTGWKLHLAGGTTPGEEHQAYLADLFKQAHRYPIEIHPDIHFPELLDLYAATSIYWHACGYGENYQREPEKFEHFGITTVEAMAAGCVPVVIAKGGQPEIVQHGKNGFLWNNAKELEESTQRLMRDIDLRQALSQQAVKDSRNYSKEAFFNRLDELLKQIGA